MVKDKIISNEKIEELITGAAKGNWDCLLELVQASYESVEAAIATADLLLEGKGKVRSDSATAFAFYSIASMRGDTHSRAILEENSSFDVDARYFLNLIDAEPDSRPDIKNLFDLELLFRNQGTDVPKKGSNKDDYRSEKKEHHEITPEAKKWMEERNKLNAKVKEWVDKRDKLNHKIQEIAAEAEECKNRRNEFNQKVKELKSLRDGANRRVSEMSSGGQSIDGSRKIAKNCPSVKQLKQEMSDLQNKLQYQVLKKAEEKAIIGRITELDNQINDLSNNKKGIVGTKKDADYYHAQVSVYAEKAQEEHEKMAELFGKVDQLRKQADEAHEKFISYKKKADEAHKKYRDCLKNHI